MKEYLNLSFRAGGRTREGIDCAGLAMLWLREQLDIIVPEVETRDSEAAGQTAAQVLQRGYHGLGETGSVIFFRKRKDTFPTHVAVHLGEGKLLHILNGCESRIDNGITLLGRLKMSPCATVSPVEVPLLAAMLNDKRVMGSSVVLFVIGVVLSFASSFLLKPKLPRLGNNRGRYSDGALVTSRNPEIPLPDILGQVVTAGNLVYQQLPVQSDATADPQRSNLILVLSAAPAEIDSDTVRFKGLPYNDRSFEANYGFYRNPTQDYSDSVEGAIGLGTAVPSFTVYDGEHAIAIEQDVRGEWDRDFPVHGLPGVAHLVIRSTAAAHVSGFNTTTRVMGARCRTFTDAGFDVTSVAAESLTGANGSKVRFKMAFDDIKEVTSVEVNSVAFTEMSATNQSGNVFSVNRTKGYLEFPTAPAAAATIEVDYDYYPREWTRNPAAHLVYMLTETRRGRGWPEDKIDWPAAESFYDYAEASIDWEGDFGAVTEERYRADYAVDFRQPLQDHARAILDGAYATMFLSGGKVTFKQRAAASSVFSFDESNMLLVGGKSAFEIEDVDRQDRPNEVRVLFHSDETHNAEGEVARRDTVDQDERAERIGNNGVADVNLKFPAVTSRTQAERIAEQIVRENRASRQAVQITTNVKGLALQPGDIVDVTHSSKPGWSSKEFRIEEIGHDEQDRLRIRASEYANVFI